MLPGRTVPVDAGCCNGRLFLNGLGIGFDGAIVRDLLGQSCFMNSVAHAGRYGGRFLVAPRASLSDSRLDISKVRYRVAGSPGRRIFFRQ